MFYVQDFATRSLKISEETPEVAMELLTEDAEVFLLCYVQIYGSFVVLESYNLALQFLPNFSRYSRPRRVHKCFDVSGCSKCRKPACSLWTKENMGNQVHCAIYA